MFALRVFACFFFVCSVESGLQEEVMVKVCRNKLVGNYPNVKDCSKYFQCVNGQLSTVKCITGQSFDDEYRRCIRSQDATCAADNKQLIKIVTKPMSLLKPKHIKNLPSLCSPNFYNLIFTFGATYENKGRKYEASHEGFRSYVESESECESICGHLAVMDDKEEENFIRGLMETNRIECLLIAGRKAKNGKEFFKRKGKEPLKYINWAPDQPEVPDDRIELCIFYRRGFSGMVRMPCAQVQQDCRYMCEL
ncbi:unnamed protein product [Lymnaea stagnalis]|uniref:Uncharacterized protein n=1 Tax=Lymnaea stagnalis TaxID=6523 RepID=A0AAV2I4B2_LYMST